MQTQRHRSLQIGKTHDQHLEACCRGISSCWSGDNPKLPSSHQHCYQYLNGAKVRLFDLHSDDSWCRTQSCKHEFIQTGERWFICQTIKLPSNQVYIHTSCNTRYIQVSVRTSVRRETKNLPTRHIYITMTSFTRM